MFQYNPHALRKIITTPQIQSLVMSAAISKKLDELKGKVATLTSSMTIPELKQKKIDRDAELKKKEEETEKENAKV